MKNYIHAAICVDTSSSMLSNSLASAAQRSLNDLLSKFVDCGQPGDLSLFSFSDDTKHHWTRDFSVAHRVEHLHFGGWTRLYSTVDTACRHIWGLPTTFGYTPVYVVHVLTDGEDNRSVEPYDAASILHKEPNWTFAIVGPQRFRSKMARDLNIPEDLILPWDGVSEKSYVETQVSTQDGFSNYLRSVAAGKPKVERFYAQTNVKKDLSGLPDMSPLFREYEVKADSRIDHFTTGKTRRDYVTGQTFYELIKDELVQARKAIVMKNKNTGVTVVPRREDIGLPNGADAKVVPGNHGDWRVFVQSTAPNRKLPRGSRVLIDHNKRKGEVPTWQ